MAFWTLVLIALTTQLSFSNQGIIDSDSGIHGPNYSQILTLMEGWRNKHPDLVTLIDYGTSVQGKTLRLALVKKTLTFQQELAIGQRPTFIMSGSTHGNEYLNIEDRLPQELLNLRTERGPVRSFINEGGVFLFIPILNPDGYDARERENANGIDLNRDWDVVPANFQGFSEVETKSLAQTVKSLAVAHSLKYEVTIDYHCCIGALLYPWSYTTDKLPNSALADHVKMGEIANKNLGVEYGITADVLGYLPLGTTKDYYYATYGARAFTYEGRYGSEQNYLSQHVTWWKQMITEIHQTMQKFPLYSEGFTNLL